MRFTKIFAIICGAAVLIAANGNMSVATFLAKAEALQKQGMTAMFSSDAALLKAEMKSVAESYRAMLAAQKKAGTPQHSCPPPKGQVKMNSNEMLDHLRSYSPAARKTTNVRTAFYAMMKKRFPCK
jgi:hypothetical protein